MLHQVLVLSCCSTNAKIVLRCIHASGGKKLARNVIASVNHKMQCKALRQFYEPTLECVSMTIMVWLSMVLVES